MDNKIVYQSTTDFLKFLNDRVKSKTEKPGDRSFKSPKKTNTPRRPLFGR